MSKRLQVLLDETEYREVQQLARSRHVTVAAWVREAIREARRSLPSSRSEDKLRTLRAAVRHSFPTADIDQMLAEIERGYSDGGVAR
ncbi:MAG TPA: ribbon-helix-helix protein, CopG family [Anaeromyxobacteraceae bacterium]|nr:ribbon-helix-helix protein, CopG family [Anaeromyxobacteraceae bacterium]